MQLKADFHMHVNKDPLDHIYYSAKELINQAAKLKFDVLAITCHDYVFPIREIQSYAKKKGILLIQGAEKTLQGKHVLLYNINNSDLAKIKTFEDLKKLKQQKNILVIAPHPYYPIPFCLRKELEKNIDLFDAIEHSHAHTPRINFNKKAVETAKKYSKTLIGNSDTHHLFQLGLTYSLIDCEKNADAIIEAIKNGRVKVVSPPLNFQMSTKIGWWVGKSLIKKLPKMIRRVGNF